MRSMTSGRTPTGVPAGAITTPPASASRARSNRSGVSVCSVSSGCPARTMSPGPRVQLDARARLHRVLLARAAGAEPPGGDADRVARRAPSASRRPRPAPARSRAPPAGSRRRRRPGPRSSASTRPSRARRPARPRGRRGTPAAASISRASATVSSTTSAGPPPASTSTDSRTSSALPAVRPSGVDMSVSSATVRTPASVPSSTIVRASSRARSTSFMNAPEPDLDVEHERAGALGDLLAHDRRGDQRDRLDGAGDVAQRVELAVGGRQARARLADDRADVVELAPSSRRCSARPASRGSTRACPACPPVWPEPAAGQLRHRDAEDGDQRRERQRDLVAHAARRVLVRGRAGTGPEKSIRSPDAIIAAVQRAISARSMPLSRIAMVSADICSSATAPRV